MSLQLHSAVIKPDITPMRQIIIVSCSSSNNSIIVMSSVSVAQWRIAEAHHTSSISIEIFTLTRTYLRIRCQLIAKTFWLSISLVFWNNSTCTISYGLSRISDNISPMLSCVSPLFHSTIKTSYDISIFSRLSCANYNILSQEGIVFVGSSIEARLYVISQKSDFCDIWQRRSESQEIQNL